MSAYKSDFLNVLASRGYVHQVSDADGLDALAAAGKVVAYVGDRKSTRLNSSHQIISYAVFCLKKQHQQCHRRSARHASGNSAHITGTGDSETSLVRFHAPDSGARYPAFYRAVTAHSAAWRASA